MPQQNCKLDSFKANAGQKNVCGTKRAGCQPDGIQGHSLEVLKCLAQNGREQAHINRFVPMLITEHDAEGQRRECHGLYRMQPREVEAARLHKARDCQKFACVKACWTEIGELLAARPEATYLGTDLRTLS